MFFEGRNHPFKYKEKKRETIHVKSRCCGFTPKAVDILSHCLNAIRDVRVTIAVQRPVMDKQIISRWTEVPKTWAFCLSCGAGCGEMWGVRFSSLPRSISCPIV